MSQKNKKQERKKMKKILGLLVVALFVSSSAFAEMSTLDPFAASVSFSGGVATFSAVYSGSGNITWSTTGINLGQEADQWKTAEGYITLTKNITDANGKVYVYTDNKNGGTTYKATNGWVYSEDLSDLSWAGLVKGGSDGGNNNFKSLAFIVMDEQGTPDWSKLTTTSADYRYLTDKSTVGSQAFAKSIYNTIADVNGYVGIEDSAATTTAYMYIGANFTKVYSGESYGTDKIIFEYGIE